MQTFWSKQLNIILTSFLLMAFTTASFANNTIEGLRIWPSPNTTRLVFDLADTPTYTYFTLKSATISDRYRKHTQEFRF